MNVIYRDASASVERRVSDLMSRMSLREKVGQLNQRLFGWKAYRRDGSDFELTAEFRKEVEAGQGLGAMYGLFRADPWSAVTWDRGITPEYSAKVANMVQRYVIENTRLGIPVLLSEECSHGHQSLGGTLLPVNIGVGCSWNPGLLEEAMDLVAASVRARGATLGLVSCLDMMRDPRWGRAEECYSEDPFLAARMVEAVTRGLQGSSIEDLKRTDKIAAVLKHFCAQGAGSGGHNAGAVCIGERELREIHLPPCRAGVRAGARSFMAAYNEIDGVPCNGNEKLLTGMLRGEWSFDGVVMGDGYAVDGLSAQTGSFESAGILALKSGVDMSLWDEAFTTLESAVNDGRCPVHLVDRAVMRVLSLKFQLGLFDKPYVEEDSRAVMAVNSRARDINLKLARESLVLLRNEGEILPLCKDLRRIAVIGPNADNLYNQLGDYTAPQAPGSGVTVLAGIRAAAAPGTEVVYARGCGIRDLDMSGFDEAFAVAKGSDVAVLVVGGSSARNFDIKFDANGAAVAGDNPSDMDCGEGIDVCDLDLGGVQEELVKAIAGTGVPTVVVLVQGRPHSIPWLAEHCPAILCAWYPGQEGGTAVAEAIFGDINPSGRLSVSIPRCSGQLPVCYNHKSKGETAYRDMQGSPLYKFGYGLSYTTFEISDLRIEGSWSVQTLEGGGNVEVLADICNIGKRRGVETVQLYIQDLESSVTRRVMELKAFSRIELDPAEKKSVRFRLDREAFGVWNTEMSFVLEPGNVKLMVGGGVGIVLEEKVELTA